jgi:hypothetical protein
VDPLVQQLHIPNRSVLDNHSALPLPKDQPPEKDNKTIIKIPQKSPKND